MANKAIDEDTAELYKKVNENKAAQYFGNSPQEGPEYREGGEADNILDEVSIKHNNMGYTEVGRCIRQNLKQMNSIIMANEGYIE